MWLALCHPMDVAAHWAVVGLRRRGVTPFEAVAPEALVYSRSLVHEIRGGRTSTTFTLPDGRRLDLSGVRGVLNRVTGIPADHTMAATPGDRQYAAQEMHAVTLSVLHGMGRTVLNRPSPRGLAGSVRSELEWAALASGAGLRVAVRREASDVERASPRPALARRFVVVLDGRAYGGPVSAEVGAACARLSAAAQVRLLGVELLVTRDGDCWFHSASPTPDLRAGGDALLDALADTFRGEHA